MFSATAIAGNGDTTETIQTRAGDFTFETDFSSWHSNTRKLSETV
ncbi:hypothetical protein O9992_20845 [Vibrio lentus]|nr:hypothetical protein [Vibrio lentus]